MTSKSSLFSKLLGSGTSGTIPQTSISSDVSFGVSTYDNISTLPLSGNNVGDQAFVDSDNRLYIWNGAGWYNIALINTSPSITGGYESSYVFETDGTPIEITLVGSDPEGIPLTWSYEVTSGSLTNGGGTTATVSNVDNVFTITPSTTEDYSGSFSLTFKASDGVNLGTAVSSFTLAFKILNSSYTTLLAKGVAATQNATFVDSSTNAHTITRNGDVYQGTFSPYREGGYSMYFDGSGDFLSGTLSGDEFGFGTGDFTVELWYCPSAAVTSEYLIDTRTATLSAGVWLFTFNFTGSNSGTLYWYNGSATLAQASGSFSIDVWSHIVYVRSGTTGSMYINGQRVATQTDSQNYVSPLGFSVGNRYSNTGSDQYVKGYLSNVRVVNGTAVYDPTQATLAVPTAPLAAITNTSLLINTPYIADSSSNARAITVNGNTSTQPFSPFDHDAYDEAGNGGSAYFDGDGDYLSTATNAAFTLDGDFTIEMWVNPSSLSIGGLFSNGAGAFGGNAAACILSHGTAVNKISFWVYNISTTGNILVSNELTIGTWTHIAIVRSGETITMYQDGKSTDTYTSSSTIQLSGTLLRVGAYWNGYFNGHISNLRVVKGTAVYTSDFTPPTAPLTAITNTSLLLNFTNAGIQDYSQVSDLKLLGNATGSNTQTKNASYSMYFDGTGDYIVASNELLLSSSDFTVELWWYPTSTSRQALIHGSSGYDYSWGIDFSSVGTQKIGIWASSNGSSWNLVNSDGGGAGTGTQTINQNAWNHIVFTRSGTTLRSFVNGVLDVEITGVSAAIATRTTNNPIIGNWFNNTYSVSGYIEDLRITKGLARYTANFIPPTSELLG